MREDMTQLVERWDNKTAKKAKKWRPLLEEVESTVAADETAIALSPARMTDPDSSAALDTIGFLCLTDRRLVFRGARGNSLLNLEEIDEINIYSGGGGSFLVSMTTGGLIEVRVGPESSYFEISTQSSTAEMWQALQEQWTAAKSNAKEGVSTPTNGVADELKKLADLRAEGILTEEEFVVEKQRLLSR